MKAVYSILMIKNIFVERFKGRLIFPIKNISGHPIALGGRIIEKSDYLAKYINSPETIFFKKGSNLYNLDKARKLSNKFDHVYLVEGYMDVVGMSRNGIENTVANLGTSLTDRQISILNQFFDDIIICFDGDESGYKAALRAAENSIKELKPEKQISFLFYLIMKTQIVTLIRMEKIILLILQNKIKYLFINSFLVITKNKLKTILHQWQFLKKDLEKYQLQ